MFKIALFKTSLAPDNLMIMQQERALIGFIHKIFIPIIKIRIHKLLIKIY